MVNRMSLSMKPTSWRQHDGRPDFDLGIKSENDTWADRNETFLEPLHLPDDLDAV